MYDDSEPDTCRITVIATGIDQKAVKNDMGMASIFNRQGMNQGVRPNVVRPVSPNGSAINNTGYIRQQAPAQAQVPNQNAQTPRTNFTSSLQRPVDLKSKVAENQLTIPAFLQKK